MKRLNLGFTANIESSIFNYLVKFIPKFITPDILTLIALFSALLSSFMYLFVEYNRVFLLCINLGLAIHWLADSLDGKLARYRHQERPRYGYYVDHILDSISAALFIGGLTTSNATQTTAWIWVLALMLLSMIHVFLKNRIYKVFELSIQQFGPTEARLGLFTINLLIFFIGNPRYYIFNIPTSLLDIIGWIVVIGFLLVLIPEIIRTATFLDKKEKIELNH